MPSSAKALRLPPPPRPPPSLLQGGPLCTDLHVLLFQIIFCAFQQEHWKVLHAQSACWARAPACSVHSQNNLKNFTVYIVGPHVQRCYSCFTYTLHPHNLVVNGFFPTQWGMLTSSKGCMLHFTQLDLLTSWEHVWNTFSGWKGHRLLSSTSLLPKVHKVKLMYGLRVSKDQTWRFCFPRTIHACTQYLQC